MRNVEKSVKFGRVALIDSKTYTAADRVRVRVRGEYIGHFPQLSDLLHFCATKASGKNPGHISGPIFGPQFRHVLLGGNST